MRPLAFQVVAIDPRVHVSDITVRVADVERSVAFYGGLLGLEVLEADGEAGALGAAGGGRVLVRLRRSAEPGPVPRRATGLFHTALRWPDRAGLGSVLLRVARARWPFTGASDHGVSEALYLDDPDGHGVELYRDRPREAWPEPGPGDRVGMYTAALDLEALAREADGRGTERVDVGHVHFKVADLAEAERFWGDVVGLELMQRFGTQAAFLAAGGYHHHVGVNTWHSRGAAPGPASLPGLASVALAYPDEAARDEARGRLAGATAVPAGVAVEAVLTR